MSLNCTLDFTQSKTNVISVYNPNLDVINGLFLNATKGHENLKVVLMDSDLRDIEAQNELRTELLCSKSPSIKDNAETQCELFVDIAVEGLLLIHLGVTEIAGESQKKIENRQIYSYSVKQKKILQQMDSSGQELVLGDQTLTLKKIDSFLQRSISLTYDSGNEMPLDFAFSIESKSNDFYGSGTGHYMMTVKDQQKPSTNQTMVIEKVEILQGQKVARINVHIIAQKNISSLRNKIENCVKRIGAHTSRDNQNALRFKCIEALV